MFSQVFALAMKSPGRQRTFRRAIVLHVFLTLGAALTIDVWQALGQVLFGQLMLVAAIVEGATLLGWRLTQMPKSQALEFILVTPQLPRRIFLAEALAGLVRLGLVTLSGLPVFVILVCNGKLQLFDLPVLLIMPFTWGTITGLGLIAWAYEPLLLRKLGEKLILLGIIIYLGIGVLVGERLGVWLDRLPTFEVGGVEIKLRGILLFSFHAFHEWNPFGVMQAWMQPDATPGAPPPIIVDERMTGLEITGLVLIFVLLLRAASRLQGHFHERHYKPAEDVSAKDRGDVGDRPLAWWAVKRVSEYSGRANLWVAGGFGMLYAAYTVAGPAWPDWLGRLVFFIFDHQMGGIPVVSTALVVLAAVPAAFQYGLWDSNVQDRSRRLELLLLTGFEGQDYWDAAAAAAWKRGRGYLFVAGILWLAAFKAGQLTAVQLAAALASAMTLWGSHFVLGFRGFANGTQANGLGSVLTLGLPLLTMILFKAGLAPLAALVPTGNVYIALTEGPTPAWFAGLSFLGIATLVLAGQQLRNCDAQLRHWYNSNHGQQAAE